MAGRRDISIPSFKDAWSGYYVLPVRAPSFRAAGLKPDIISATAIARLCFQHRRRSWSSREAFSCCIPINLTDNCFDLCLGVYDEPDLSDITTGSPVGAQDSQLALADPLKNTDAATSAVRTLMDLSDITTGSPVGAQDFQLAPADPLKNTDAATSAPNAAQEYCLD